MMREEGIWEGIGCLFQGERDDDPDGGFDRFAQIRLTSDVLTYLRNAQAKLWKGVWETRGIGTLNERDHGGVREFKKLLEHLVRCADESRNHRRTVSFVSRSVIKRIWEASGGRPTITHLKSKEFSHEHGVPVDAVIRTIVHPKNVDVNLYDVLNAMSCRALLLRQQSATVDSGFKSALAGSIKMPWGSYPVGALPLRYLALARYNAASPTLLDELIPTSRRAAMLLAEFKEFVRGPAAEAAIGVERMMVDHRAAPLAYLPDYAFDWARV